MLFFNLSPSFFFCCCCDCTPVGSGSVTGEHCGSFWTVTEGSLTFPFSSHQTCLHPKHKCEHLSAHFSLLESKFEFGRSFQVPHISWQCVFSVLWSSSLGVCCDVESILCVCFGPEMCALTSLSIKNAFKASSSFLTFHLFPLSWTSFPH